MIRAVILQYEQNKVLAKYKKKTLKTFYSFDMDLDAQTLNFKF